MWWSISLPEPHDARPRQQHVATDREVIRPRSYAALGMPASAAAQPQKATAHQEQKQEGTRAPIERAADSVKAVRPTTYGVSQIESVAPTTYGEESRTARSLKQFSLFAGGAAMVVMSAVITRRALARKYLSIKPSGLFSPSNKVDGSGGSLDAFEALSLATLNVTSFAIMMLGGGLWAADISSLDELRAKVRKEMGTSDRPGATDQESDEDIEEWMATVLARLQGKGGPGITDLVKDLQEKEIKKAEAQKLIEESS